MGYSRRDFVRIGGLAGLGLGLADPRPSQASSGPRSASAIGRGNLASSSFCRAILPILIHGTPSRTVLPKMAVSFGLSASVPGTLLCEHLPRLALTDRYALIRSCTHDDVEHNSAAHACLTGPCTRAKGQIIPPSADDFPPFGAVFSSLRRSARPALMPAWITLPPTSSTPASRSRQQNAGSSAARSIHWHSQRPERPRVPGPGFDRCRQPASGQPGVAPRPGGRLDALARRSTVPRSGPWTSATRAAWTCSCHRPPAPPSPWTPNPPLFGIAMGGRHSAKRASRPPSSRPASPW